MSDAVINRISPDQRKNFQLLIDFADYRQLALVYSELDGKPVTVVSFVREDNDEFVVTPLAVMVDDDLRSRLADPVTVMDRENDEKKAFNDPTTM